MQIRLVERACTGRPITLRLRSRSFPVDVQRLPISMPASSAIVHQTLVSDVAGLRTRSGSGRGPVDSAVVDRYEGIGRYLRLMDRPLRV
jgi:hypothetical protein